MKEDEHKKQIIQTSTASKNNQTVSGKKSLKDNQTVLSSIFLSNLKLLGGADT